MSPPTASTLTNRSVTDLAGELKISLIALRDAMRVTLGLCQKLEQHADYMAAIAQGQPVRVKRQSPPPADGLPRGRGRPKGAPNGVTVFASPQLLAQLRAEQP